MKNGICYVVGAGDCIGLEFQPLAEDLVIAADAGLEYLEQSGIAVDLIIGDFDTLENAPTGANVITLSCEKDDTDMLAAVREGVKAGYTEFHLYGGTGGRIDHTIANLQVLAYLAENGWKGYLYCPPNRLRAASRQKVEKAGCSKTFGNALGSESIITAITNGELSFSPFPSGYISVFSYSVKAEGVYLQGLKYPLTDATLTNTFPIGTSNEFIGKMVFEDIEVDAVKVGMLSTPECMRAVAGKLRQYKPKHVVIDPVMYAKNGCPLMDPSAVDALIETILPLADVLTPNIPEAERIAGMEIQSVTDMEEAARKIHDMGCRTVVVKGGHAIGNALDVLFDGKQIHHFETERISTKNTHGTGCTFSSAIASQLALGADIYKAVEKAKVYVTTAIMHSLAIGKGCGPTHHFYELYQHGLTAQESEAAE